MVIALTANMAAGFYDRNVLSVPIEIGWALFILGFLFFCYAVFSLRRGFFGETEPNLNYLVTNGPYGIVRHPMYLSFIAITLGIDLMLRSAAGIAFTAFVSIPSTVYRARKDDQLLRKKFGRQWDEYASRVGFMLPKVGQGHGRTK